MTVPGRRAERLADQIRTELAELISAELKDPRIGFATVTGVEMSSDLRHARVSVSVLGSADAQQRSLEGLSYAAGYVRHQLAQRLTLRRVPELVFVLDHSAEENEKLETLLQKLKERK